MANTISFNMKLQPEEKAMLVTMSQETGLSYSQIIRAKVFGEDPYETRLTRIEKTVQEILDELQGSR